MGDGDGRELGKRSWGGIRGAELEGNSGGRSNGERRAAWERFAFPGRARLNESRRGEPGNWCWLVGRAFVPRDIQQPARCRASVNARPSAGLFQ